MKTPHSDSRVFFEGGGFRVTDSMLVTPRKTYRLKNIEFVSVTRPLLLFLGGPAIGMVGMTAGFWRYLYPGEIIVMLLGAAVALVIASSVATLRVHSIALRDDDVAQSFGPIARLREVRHAVERAMVGGEAFL